MGIVNSVFTSEELDNYVNLTYFTRREVLKCWRKFKRLAPELIEKDPKVRLSKKIILECSELKVNPFGDQICKIFSSTNDGKCTFEDFLDMMSVFSANAPLKLKGEYAFRMFDFNGDGVLSKSDLAELIQRLGGRNMLEDEYVKRFVDHILAEADLSDNGTISYLEFDQCLSKSKHFMETFQIRL